MTPKSSIHLRFASACCACIFLLIAVIQVRAMYIGPDIETVPVDRLIRNLEQLVSTNPKSVVLHHNLARVHAMAFALKMEPTQATQITRGKDYEGVWFGHEHDIVPFRAVATKDPAILEAAKQHLTKAIELYSETVLLDPADLTIRLGYAWCLDQSGNRGQAITAYRSVIADGWSREQSIFRENEAFRNAISANQGVAGAVPPPRPPSTGPGWRSVTVEAAGYLIPLLDREKDKDEITTLTDRLQQFSRMGRSITPIVIPLRDGVTVSELLDRTAQISFDADGSGIPKRWTWITPNAGWLVHAPRKSHPVTSALQMFGNITFWLFWENGYQALSALDDNGDGALQGSELDGLAVWRDSNRNGKDEEGEVKTLAEWGIVSLSCDHEVLPENTDYVAFSSAGVTLANGRTRPTYDILLHSSEAAMPALTTRLNEDRHFAGR